MTNIEKYKIFLIEQYRAKNNLRARDVYNLFEKHKIFEYIDQTFEAIHTIDNNEVIQEIDELINHPKGGL